MASPPNLSALIRQGSLARGLDPAAVLAVAGQEGLSGRVGDQGTSFGPFQLHVGGAFPSSVGGNRQAWATSQPGLNYALDRIGSVAKGLHGSQAVNAIVRRFERPADPGGEVSRALAGYGGSPAGSGAQVSPGSPSLPSAAAARPGGNQLLASLIESTNQMMGLGGSPSLASLLAKAPAVAAALQRPVNAAWGTPGSSSTGGKAGQGQAGLPPLKPATAGLAELLREGTGGPTHSTGPHVHAAFTDPKLELAAIGWAQQHGLNVGENPYVGSVAPVHASRSYHTQTFPGLFNGRRLGQAIDVTGPQMGAFYSYLAGRR